MTSAREQVEHLGVLDECARMAGCSHAVLGSRHLSTRSFWVEKNRPRASPLAANLDFRSLRPGAVTGRDYHHERGATHASSSGRPR